MKTELEGVIFIPDEGNDEGEGTLDIDRFVLIVRPKEVGEIVPQTAQLGTGLENIAKNEQHQPLGQIDILEGFLGIGLDRHNLHLEHVQHTVVVKPAEN